MIEDELAAMGYGPEQISEIADLVDRELDQRALPRMAEVLHRIFLRVDRDSIAGRALSRALGFTNEQSLERAARDFGVSKQYLHLLEAKLAAQLRGLDDQAGRGR